jgi:hypothetical protein
LNIILLHLLPFRRKNFKKVPKTLTFFLTPINSLFLNEQGETYV